MGIGRFEDIDGLGSGVKNNAIEFSEFKIALKKFFGKSVIEKKWITQGELLQKLPASLMARVGRYTTVAEKTTYSKCVENKFIYSGQICRPIAVEYSEAYVDLNEVARKIFTSGGQKIKGSYNKTSFYALTEEWPVEEKQKNTTFAGKTN